MTTETSTASSLAQNFKPGDKIAGCYTLQEILPFDGPGVVWLVQDEELNKRLTLHFLPDTVVADARAMNEIKQETKRNRQIVHPHILRVHDLIEEDNWAAITMDYIEGETVAALKKKKEHGLFNVPEISAWVAQLCQTLEDTHKIDFLHRDLAPENLLVTSAGLTVMNFGISRAILDSLSRSGQKVHGDGNLAYMSPQQLDGERPSKWDDIYSLGAVIYDLLTSTPPFFKGDLIAQIRKAVPPTMTERRQELGFGGEPIPKTWEKTVALCLDKHTAQRPNHAVEVAAAIKADKEIPASEPSSAPEPPAAAEAESIKETGEEAVPAISEDKKPWGPAKTPVITEATVVSQTSLGKKGEGESYEFGEEEPFENEPAAAERKAGPTTPSGFPLRAFVGVDEQRPERKTKVPGSALAIAAVLLVIGIAAYVIFSGPEKKDTDFSPAVTKLEPAQKASSQKVAPPASHNPSEIAEKVELPTKPSAAAPIIVAKNDATPRPVAVSPTATPSAVAVASSSPLSAAGAEPGSKLAQAIQAANEKTKIADAARQKLAALTQAQADNLKAEQAAEAGLKEVQATEQQKLAAAAAAKKAADDLIAAQKQREEAQKKADADADAAQKLAAEKAKAAAAARQAVADGQQSVKQQQAMLQQAEADALKYQKLLADRKLAADDSAKAAASPGTAQKQAEAAVKQAELDATAALAEVERLRQAEQASKAAEESGKIRAAREAELRRMSEQAALAAKAAADAQKALQDAQKQFDEAQKARERTAQEAAAAAKAAALPITTGASPAPSATLPPQAMAVPQTGKKNPSLTVGVPPAKLDQTLMNTLGMKFAPVGGVLFCVWQTRVQDFNAFAKATGLKSTAWMQPGFRQGPDHPVVNVSWNDSVAFCKWLTEKERKEGLLAANQAYRLPTDLEWSKAVGLPEEAGRTPEARDMDVPDQYPWGTQWPPPEGSGNYTGEETGSDVAIKGYDDGFAWTSPVGSFHANKFGLFDMGGNVWQWCMDWWNDEHRQKVLRGGSWYNGALKLSLLSSCRVHAAPDSYTDNYGFRVVVANETGKNAKR